jgi:hypothetical protein
MRGKVGREKNRQFDAVFVFVELSSVIQIVTGLSLDMDESSLLRLVRDLMRTWSRSGQTVSAAVTTDSAVGRQQRALHATYHPNTATGVA